MTTKFKVGQTYETRSACDYDCIFSFTVVKRTDKSITIKDRHGRIARRGVKVCQYDNAERCLPLGSYSMAPVITANRTTV